MNRSVLLLAGALALVAGGLGDARAQAKKKLYRWVDANGKVQISDTLPPDQVGQARREINADTGTTQKTIERELTPEEQAAADLAAAQAAAAALITEQQQRDEDAMLNSYDTEVDLQRAYGERISLLKQTLESTDISLSSLRESLAAQLASAAEAELYNRPVDPKRLDIIRDRHQELIKQRVFQANRHRELLSLDAEYARMLERYRERRAAEAAEKALKR